VEVVKGAGSALYGSAALGGVVNVITREIPSGFHARVRALGGAYANPPFDVWRFRDYTGALEGLDVTTSYGTAAARGSYTAGRLPRRSGTTPRSASRGRHGVPGAAPTSRISKLPAMIGAWPIDTVSNSAAKCTRRATAP